MLPSPLRFAVIGTGHLGTIHTRLLAQQPDACVAFVVDPDSERAGALAAEVGASWVAAVEELPSTSVDAVIIAAPTSLHSALARIAIDNEWHCFIEKPVTATVAEADELAARAASSNVVIQVGHVERFNPAIAALHQYPVQPRFIEVHRLSAFKPRAIDVSVVQDLMIHDIDLLLWLTGSTVVDIHATGVSVLTPTPDICNARLTFASGCVANVTASRISAKPMRKLRIFQADSYASVDMGAGTIEMFRLIEAPSFDASHQTPLGTVNTQFGDRMIVVDSPSVQPQNAIAEEQRRFIESIRTGTSAAVTLSDGIEAVRIAARIEEVIQHVSP